MFLKISASPSLRFYSFSEIVSFTTTILDLAQFWNPLPLRVRDICTTHFAGCADHHKFCHTWQAVYTIHEQIGRSDSTASG
jgi:hypothetical protein